MSMFTALILVLLVIVGIFILNYRAFQKLKHYGKTKVGNFGREAEQQDPVNQMREAAEDAKDQVHMAREALVKNKSLKDSLERQINNNKKEIAIAEAKLKRFKDEGRTKSDPEVVAIATKLAQARKDLETNQEQFEVQKQIYSNTLESAKKAASKIKDLERKANNLEVRLDTSAAQAELAEMLDSYNSSGATLTSAISKAAKFEEIAEQRIAANNAKLQVNKDLGLTSSDDDDSGLDIDLATASILDDFESPTQTKVSGELS